MKNIYKQRGIGNIFHHNSISLVKFNGIWRANCFLVNPKHGHEVFYNVF